MTSPCVDTLRGHMIQTCVVMASNDVTIIMFDLHAVIRRSRFLLSSSSAFINFGSLSLSSFSALTVNNNYKKQR